MMVIMDGKHGSSVSRARDSSSRDHGLDPHCDTRYSLIAYHGCEKTMIRFNSIRRYVLSVPIYRHVRISRRYLKYAASKSFFFLTPVAKYRTLSKDVFCSFFFSFNSLDRIGKNKNHAKCSCYMSIGSWFLIIPPNTSC